MPPKIRELKKQLRDAGFLEYHGKGSHTNWIHASLPVKLTIAGKDGADAKPYQEKDVRLAILVVTKKVES